MAHNLTEAATFATNVPVPDDGDDDAATASADVRVEVEETFSALANRTQYLAQNRNGEWLGERPEVFSSTGGTVSVRPIKGLWMGGRIYATTAQTDITPSGMAAGQRFLYAYISAGAIAFEISATAPAVGRVFKDGDPTRRYVSFLHATSAVAVTPFRLSAGGRYTYHRSGTAFVAVVLAAGADTTPTEVPVTDWVPSHARTVELEAVLEASAGSGYHAELWTHDGEEGLPAFAIHPPITGGACQVSRPVTIPVGFESGLGSGRCVRYQLAGAGAVNLTLTLSVNGYFE